SAEANCQRIENMLETAYQWADQHASVFAPEKFVITHFCKDKKQDLTAKLHTRGITIEPAETIRVLGIHLDSWLTFLPHARKLESAATKRLGAMAAIAGSTWGFSLIDMQKVYLGAVVPQVFFGSSVWLALGSAGSGVQTSQTKILQILSKSQK